MSSFINVKINTPNGLLLLRELEAVGVITLEKPLSKPFNGKQFRGIVPQNESGKFNEHLKNIRAEWERDI
jgi:hypothetical protein